jgi:hypothetical protein
MQQSRRRSCERNQLLLKRVSLVIVAVGKKSTTERDEVMKVRHCRPVDVWELNDEVLTGQAAHLDALRSRSARQDSCYAILRLPVRNDLQLIAPGAFPLQS